MFFLFLFVFLFPAAVISDTPRICNKLFVSRFYDYYSIGTLIVSANLELIPTLNGTNIFVSNVSVNGNVNLGIADSICVNVDFSQSFPTPEACSTSLNGTFNFTTKKPSFDLQIHFSNSYHFLYFGFADNGTFSFKDGRFFSLENPTFTEIQNQTNSLDIFTQTCTLFVPAPTPPPLAAYAPKCKTFKSQILVLNTTDNYSIYASSYMEWNLGDKFEGTGNSTIPGNFYVDYILNSEDDSCNGAGCSFSLMPGDKKLIISAAIRKRVGYNLITFPIPMVGRIILRGENQTLMGEGIPFSTKNNCLYFNFPYSTDQVSTNKFCCTEFEDS